MHKARVELLVFCHHTTPLLINDKNILKCKDKLNPIKQIVCTFSEAEF